MNWFMLLLGMFIMAAIIGGLGVLMPVWRDKLVWLFTAAAGAVVFYLGLIAEKVTGG